MAERMSEDELAAVLAGCPGPGIYLHRASGLEVRVLTAALREGDLVPVVVYRHYRNGRVTWTRLASEFAARFKFLKPNGE